MGVDNMGKFFDTLTNVRLDKLKQQYNNGLKRVEKADKFFSSQADWEAKEKQLENYNELVRELSGLIKEYKEITGKRMLESEILEGFYVQVKEESILKENQKY